MMSRKRRRDPGSVETRLAEAYEDLANESEEIRLKAAQSLLRETLLLPKTSVDNPPSKEKILVRLVRGLCSGRKAARLGFSIAFTEFLVQQLGRDVQLGSEGLEISDIVKVLRERTDIGGNVSGQEERDHQLGRVFGAEAVIKSGILFDSSLTADAWSQILDLVFELAQRKAWLREECGWIMYKSIQNLKACSNGSIYARILVDKMIAYGLAKSPEGVALWLGIQTTFPSIALPPSVWQQENPLHRKEKTTLAKVLKEASTAGPPQAEADPTITKKTTWSSNLHFAWDIVLASLLQQDDANQGSWVNSISFADFWIEVVDNSLFSASASDQRKYWGFVLFQRAILSAPASLISVVFCKNFMRCLMNQLASSDRYLHRSAEKAVRSIYARIEVEPLTATTVLACLVKPPAGRINFDQVTKTKTVEKLLFQVKDDNLSDLVQLYSVLISKPAAQDEKAALVERQIAADHLLSVVRAKQAFTDAEVSVQSEPVLFVQRVLALFAKHAYFGQRPEVPRDGETSIPRISEATRSIFRGRISSCLAHVVAKSKQPARFIYNLIDYIRSQDQKGNGYIPLPNNDGSVAKAIDKGWAVLKKIHSKEVSAQGPKKRFLSAFELLYALTLLQTYNGDADAVSMLDELKDCYDNLVKHKSRPHQASSDGLVEILLGFAAKPSSLFRRLAFQVFSACTSDVSENSLQSLIKVLETKESVVGQDELFDQENVTDEGSVASDVEIDEIGSENEGASSSDDILKESTGTDEVTDDNSDAATEALAVLDAKLASVLDAHGDDGPSDEDMNDEQMEALDEHLEKIFRERKNVTSRKIQDKDAKEAIVNFKCRVLELLDVYIKQEHKNLLALQLLVPVLNVIRVTKSAVVSSKACDLIGNYFKLCKPNSVPCILDAGAVLTLLRSVHKQASMEGSNAYSSACSRASLLLVKTLAAQDRENLRLVESIYGQTHQDFMLNKNSKTKPSFFSDWLNWSVTARKR